MKDVVVSNLISLIIKYKNYDEIKLAEIKYGIESFYLTITKTIVIFGLSYFLGTIKTLLLLMLFYTFLRLNGYGLHAKKSWQCWLGSILVFILLPYLCLIVRIDKIYLILASIICLFFIFKYAPADTEKRPIISKRKRHIHKYLCSITTIIYICLIYFLHSTYLQNILFFSIILETIMILPVSYKIFKLKYNNYKDYLNKNCAV